MDALDVVTTYDYQLESSLNDEQKKQYWAMQTYDSITITAATLKNIKQAYRCREDLSDEVKHVLDEIIHKEMEHVFETSKQDEGYSMAFKYLQWAGALSDLDNTIPNRTSVEVEVK